MTSEKPGLNLKDAYDEIGTNYRFFLTWRHGLLAGYLAIIAGLSVAFSWLYKEAPALLWIVFAAGFAVTLLFWVLEYRNRDLYRACQESGKICEDGLPAGSGLFSRLNELQDKRITHSYAIDLFLGFALVSLVVGIIWAICRKTL